MNDYTFEFLFNDAPRLNIFCIHVEDITINYAHARTNMYTNW